jgi:hypothetical protein
MLQTVLDYHLLSVMKRVLLCSALFSGIFVMPLVSRAQTWSTGYFNSNDGYGPAGSSLDGAPTSAPASEQWQTTDPYNAGTDRGSTSLISHINGWSYGLSSQGYNSVYFGGYNADNGVLPGSSTPVLYREFDHTFGSAATTFSVDFGIVGPSTDLSGLYVNNDRFAFSLLSTNSAELATFVLNPGASLPGFLQLEWVQNGTNVVADGTTFKNFQIQYDALYRLTATVEGTSLTMDIAGLNPESGGPGIGITNYAVSTNVNVISNGAISSGLTSSDFEVAAIAWDLESGDSEQPGANYMIVNTVSVVPEPSTIALLTVAAGALAVAGWRRRHRG